MKVERIHLEREGVPPICRRAAVWAEGQNGMAPIVFLQRPKWIGDESWRLILDAIRMELPRGTEIS